MNFGYKNTAKKNLFSEEMVSFFKKRSYELLGFVLVVFGLALFLALTSYANQDVSWNTIREDISPRNIMGTGGAYLADFFFQTIGLSSYLIPFLCLVWGVHIILFHSLSYWKWRLVAVPFMGVFCAAGLGGIEWSFFVKSGGALGLVLHNASMVFLSKIGIPGWVWGLFLLVSGLAIFVFILGLSKETWLTIGRVLLSALKSVGALFQSMLLLAKKEKPMQGEMLLEEGIEMVETDLDSVPPAPLSFAAEAMGRDMDEIESSPPRPKTKPVPVTSSKTFSTPRTSSGYEFPSLDLLQKEINTGRHASLSKDALKENADHLKKTLEDFGVQGDILNAYPGPVVTLYEFKPAPGVKSARVVGLADDIARSTSSLSTRISVMPGVNALGIEIPNPSKEKVFMRSLLETDSFNNPSFNLPLALGKNISGDPVIGDLSRMPHLLIAGTTGSGKSVSINTMILSLLYRLSPDECKFIMVDPKMLELSVYDGIPHLLTPVVTDPHKAVMALKWVVREMETRYQKMSKLGVRNIEGYNERMKQAQEKGEVITHKVQTGFDAETGKPLFEEHPMDMKKLPFIVVVVDEMADLMLVAGKDIESAVQRLAQMARAAGIHLIMATQRPSVDVITGTIKANFPTRISFHVTSKIDSRTILGEQGAEQLLGQGDMLYMKPGGRILRVHGPFVEDREVERVVQFLRTQGEPVYEESIEEESFNASVGLGGDEAGGDDLYNEALSIVLREGKASTSFIQRHLQIGYNRAARIIEQMEKEGVVSKPNHVGKREILSQ
ncbi:MAG: DNA translocase FtsK [Alphaproteobacteria bacterium]